MHELKAKMEPICDMKKKLVEWTQCEMDLGKQNCDTDEMGKVIDMIKDLAKAEKDCAETAYYMEVIKAMKGEGEMPELPWFMPEMLESAGYDKYRYPSSGRFASIGHGRKYGYTLTPHPYHMDPKNYEDKMENPRLGYPGPNEEMDWGMTGDLATQHAMPHAKTFYDYKDERRFYTESGDKTHKDRADKHAMEHVEETMETIREIWKDADPDLRKKMKNNMSSLLGEMIS